MAKMSIQNDYLDKNFDQFVEQLKEWLAIPSISTLPEHHSDVHQAAIWVREKLATIGFSKSKIITTEGHPLVYAEWLMDSSQPTLLIYGHYDVQPDDPVEEWLTPPFDPTVRLGNIYARGASDDKGQTFLILAAMEAWTQTEGTLPVNVKILLEGEEEAGGAAIADYVQNNQESLQADAALICDTHMISQDQPSLITSLRGIVYTEVSVTGARSDLHSGRYGGVAPNPIHALCVLISRLKGEDGVIQIPELAAAIPAPTPAEKQFLQDDPCKLEEALSAEMGTKEAKGETGYPFLERLGLRPTLEVHGIRGGFTSEGAKTVIPAVAVAKISLRLPASLEPDKVFEWFKAAVEHNMPAGYRIQVTSLNGGKGVQTDPAGPFVQAAADALEQEFGAAPVFIRHGGSIPVAALFDDLLNLPVVLMGFGLPDDNIHAPNEKFSLRQFKKGMRTVADYLGRLRRQNPR